MDDTMMLSLAAAGIGFIAIYFVSAALGFFVALNARPSRRAAWNVGIPYALASGGLAYLCIHGAAVDTSQPFPLDPWLAPLLMAPGALVAFLLRFWHFRARWVDGVEDLAEGESLSNDDWRAGLVELLIFICLLLAWGIWRVVVKLAVASL